MIPFKVIINQTIAENLTGGTNYSHLAKGSLIKQTKNFYYVRTEKFTRIDGLEKGKLRKTEVYPQVYKCKQILFL